MELSEMKLLWQAYDVKLAATLKLNLHCIEMIQAQKIRSKLKPLFWQRIAELLLHVIVIAWLFKFLLLNFFQLPYAFSALILIVFYVICSINCMKQVMLIKRMDYSDDIVTIQSSLVMLQTYIVNYLRLTFLAIPTFLAYPIIAFKALTNFDIVSHLNGAWWNGQLIFSVAIIPVCIWCYQQVTYKNIQKKWVKYIIEKCTGSQIAKAMEFSKELEMLKIQAF